MHVQSEGMLVCCSKSRFAMGMAGGWCSYDALTETSPKVVFQLIPGFGVEAVLLDMNKSDPVNG